MKLLKTSLVFTICLVQWIEGATFQLNKVFGSNMVLIDSPRQANIFGHGVAGTVVRVEVDGLEVVVGTVGSDEEFLLTLPSYAAGGPHTIAVTHGTETITLSNVLFGEVWVCSGQSNMDFTMTQIYNTIDEIADAVNYPTIRVMKVQRVASEVELEDLPGISRGWLSPENNNGTFGQTSALCFLHSKELQKIHGKPIGAISDAWGGTRVEAWSSPSALASCGVTETPVPNPGQNNATALWNSMIYPITRMTITGALWYQGESNSGSSNYGCTFPTMIDDWRRVWFQRSGGLTDAEFPFGFIQLATTTSGNFNYGNTRWRQTAEYGYVPNERMRNVVMATGLDLEDDNAPTGAIHPRDKQTLARRLSWAMLNQHYGLDVYPLRGPEVLSAAVNGTTVVITYDQDVVLGGTVGFHAKCGNSRVAAPVIGAWANFVTIDVGLVADCAVGQLEVTYGWDSRPCDYKTCAIYAEGQYDLTQSAWKTIL